MVRKRLSIFDDWKRSEVLEIELSQADRGKKVADLLEPSFQNPSTFQLYNVDVSAEQQYFLEKELFPLVRIRVHSEGEQQIARWKVEDDIWSTDYEIPQLKMMGLDISLADKVPRLDSRLTGITLSPSNHHAAEEGEAAEPILMIEGSDEGQMLIESASEIEKFDPDFIITSNGDAFIFPLLKGFLAPWNKFQHQQGS